MLEALESYGIDASKHMQTKLTKKILSSNDIVIAMSITHKEFIRENFNIEVPLFNEMAYGKSTSVDDVHEAIPDYKTNIRKREEYMREVVRYIHDSIPMITKAIQGNLEKKLA